MKRRRLNTLTICIRCNEQKDLHADFYESNHSICSACLISKDRQYRDHYYQTFQGWVKLMLRNLPRRRLYLSATDPRKKITIDYDWVCEKFNKQRGKCAYSEFSMNTITKNPYQLSFERIDTNQGYTKSNVILICQVFNVAAGMSREKFQWLTQTHYEDIRESFELDDGEIKRVGILYHNAYHRSKKLSKKRQGFFDALNIQKKDIIEMWSKQKGRCFYSDIPMTWEKKSDWMVSLERKNPEKSYTRENCCLVCSELNGQVQLNRDIVQSWKTIH